MVAEAAAPAPNPVEPDAVVRDDEDEDVLTPLIIPITSSPSDGLFIEIFPEEIPSTSSSTLIQVLKDEKAESSVWADASLQYMQQRHPRESLAILEEACELPNLDKAQRVRILASTGIAHLSAQPTSTKARGGNQDDADEMFTKAGKLDTFFPMTWIGRGMLNLSVGRLDQAKFFFQTTLKQCGPVLPALLGMAAVLYGEGDYAGAQAKYGETIRRYPVKAGAAVRVGFGLASYRLGQVDRAKAAFARALDLDPECVQAMIGVAILDMAGLDSTAKDFSSRTEKAIRLMSMANLLDHSNAMVQNHLANHYFWKWTPVTGTVEVVEGSPIIKGSAGISLERGERIRIGTKFETTVVEELDDGTSFRLQDAWKGEATDNMKLWKTDFDRVIALAKGAYGSTTVEEIQAESLFFLARVYHVREDMDTAHKFYERACQLSPDLTPARFGLAQTFVVKNDFRRAMEHLNTLLTSSSAATDTLALLGLLEVKSGKQFEDGLAHLRKAIELDPLNPELLLLEALALKQHKAMYSIALDRYKKAIELMKRKGDAVPYEVYINSGVLCHETKQYDEAMTMYRLALSALDTTGLFKAATLENTGIEGGRILLDDNDMFCQFVDSNVKLERVEGNKTQLKVVGGSDAAADDFVAKVGEPFRVGDDVTTEVVKVDAVDGNLVLEIKDDFDPMESDGENPTFALWVKRENRLLKIPESITIAFNIARLHEVTGRPLAAIELHKAILKRNPAYVNSCLRLACIAVDCGSLKECGEWLKIAASAAPGNPEVLTLIGNLHLSLCDWAAAQPVFDGLLAKKVPNVEAYAALSLGNIYFANLHVSESRYVKHLQYASDYYKGILKKDPANAYAANGLGAVLGEKGEIFKAKEVFNRVREVSGDTIADALLNLGHIFLAQKKHPEALQMYQNYLKRTEDGTTPITSKSRVDDVVDVLLYISFAYFDWARHTELFNDANAAPADERYKKAMEHLELALGKHSKKDVILKYNLCMTRLQAANCVLQKLTRNIPRTVEEVEEALAGLQESLKVVEGLVQDKNDKKKVPIASSTLQNFLTHCRANIVSAESHLEDEKRRAAEAEAERNLRRATAEAEMKEEEIRKAMEKAEEAKRQEEMDQKAEAKMQKVQQLQANWQQEQEAQQQEKQKRSKKRAADDPESGDPNVELEEDATGDHGLFDDSDDSDVDPDDKKDEGDEKKEETKPSATQQDLFGDSDVEEDDTTAPAAPNEESENKATSQDLFGDSDGDEEAEMGGGDDDNKPAAVEQPKAPTTEGLFGDSDDEESDEELKPAAVEQPKAPTTEGLFGDSDDEESDEELVRDGKRKSDADDEDEAEQPQKKRRVLEDDDDDDD